MSSIFLRLFPNFFPYLSLSLFLWSLISTLLCPSVSTALITVSHRQHVRMSFEEQRTKNTSKPDSVPRERLVQILFTVSFLRSVIWGKTTRNTGVCGHSMFLRNVFCFPPLSRSDNTSLLRSTWVPGFSPNKIKFWTESRNDTFECYSFLRNLRRSPSITEKVYEDWVKLGSKTI